MVFAIVLLSSICYFEARDYYISKVSATYSCFLFYKLGGCKLAGENSVGVLVFLCSSVSVYFCFNMLNGNTVVFEYESCGANKSMLERT